MKKLFLFIAFLCFAGCEGIEPNTNEYIERTPKIITERTPRIITVYPRIASFDIEGHHYIAIYSSTGCGIVHAANCECLNPDKK